MAAMTTSSDQRRRHLASSPFPPDPEPVIERFVADDLVSHDKHGVGRVVGTDASGVTVDFRTYTLRVVSPFHKMSKL
jgi:hypothetical protein